MCQIYIGIWISDKRKNLFVQFYNCSFGDYLLADNVNPMPFGIVLFSGHQLLVEEEPAGSLHYIIAHSVLRGRMKKSTRLGQRNCAPSSISAPDVGCCRTTINLFNPHCIHSSWKCDFSAPSIKRLSLFSCSLNLD